ncbi:ubiquitin carboxyl-terminal hydrolase 16/45 [Anabrus simplex]|uniref:ubiquitin carboxyl-terminal hydrolase 16/45 n=1 Tax=Anabrus simplex TaxID=316456 RepID=UPI0035A2F48D
MVKKKKNRNQQEPSAQNGGDSTESGDENQVNSTGGTCCPHVVKAVDLGKVKKALKTSGLDQECAECRKYPSNLPDNDIELELSRGLWLCLKCGHQGCGRTRQQHALQHHRKPHSDSHALAADTELWNVWCYDCDTEVAVDCRKKLHECIKYLKQQDCPVTSVSKSVTCVTDDEADKCVKTEDCSKPLSDVTNTMSAAGSPKKKKTVIAPLNLPRVRGLRNLGNTCFFNAVLQNLAQTPFLLDVLNEMKEPGNPYSLPGDGRELPMIEGELGRWGGLTEVFASTLTELRSEAVETFNPEKLLQKLTQRCQQFAGGDQHDSHELLRHLLEEIRSEDLKRYQAEILHQVGLRTSVDPSVVSDDVKAKVRAYGRQASELILHPEQPFRGQLVSTLECQDCLHSSQHVETFLELSLPVIANKPQPPAVLRRKTSNDDTYDMLGNPSGEQMSKHQLKKERKQARKGRKKHKGRSLEGGDGEPAIVEENSRLSNAGESEQSDADVEDNVEQDIRLSHQVKDVVESGYSSEKAGNEDSTVESPICHPENGDSALASPDFPLLKESALPDAEDLPSMQNGDYILSRSSSPVCNGLPGVSGDLSPKKTEGVSTSIVNGELPFDNVTVDSNSELVVAISMLPNPPSELGSPLSNPETPSPVSSEVNIDCGSPASTQVHGDCTSPVSDSDRPFSRFAFHQDEDSTYVNGDLQHLSRCSPSESMFSSTYREDSDIIRADIDSKVVLTGREAEAGQVSSTSQATTELTTLNTPCNSNKIAYDDTQSETKDTNTFSRSPGSILKDTEMVSVNGLADKLSDLSLAADNRSPNSDKVLPLPNGDVRGRLSSGGDSVDWSVTMAPRYQCEDEECSVQSCLNQFTVLELMTGNNKVVCENCTKRFNQGKEGKMVCTNSTKQYLVSSPPAVLILHLKRFEVHRTVFRKITRHVSFPLVLDLAPICSAKCRELPILRPDQTQVLYALYGVVEHSGTLHGGHYVAYVKVRAPLKPDDPRWTFLPSSGKHQLMEESPAAAGGTVEPPPGKWYYVSDTRVNEVQEDRVLRSQAYLLFYERIW